MKGCICHFTKWQIHFFMAKETLWLGYVIRKQLMGLSQLSQIKNIVETKRTCWSRFFTAPKTPYLGLFRRRDGACLNSVGETKETVNNRSTGASAAFRYRGGGLKSLHLIPLKCLKICCWKGVRTLLTLPLEGPGRLSNRIGGAREAVIKTESVVLLGPGRLLTTGQAVLEWPGRLLTTEPTLQEGMKCC